MEAKPNKYLRTIREVGNNDVEIAVQADVYEILEGFNVTCPARQHAAKKILCSGIRGKGDATQDLIEARDAINRAIELEIRRVKLRCEEEHENLAESLVGSGVPSRPVLGCEVERTEGTHTSAPANLFGSASAGAVRSGQRTSAGTSKATRKR